MRMTLEDRLKQQFAIDFSLLNKNWKKKPYYSLAESAAKRKQHAHLPIDMLLYSLDIQHEVTLESDVFDFLTYDGCKEYDSYLFDRLPSILEQVVYAELKNRHIYSLCKCINKKCWEKGKVSEGILIANLILEKKRQTVRKELEFDLKWALIQTRRDDCKLSLAELQQFIAFAESLKYRSPDFITALDKAKSKYVDVHAAETLVAIIKRIFPRIKKDNFDLFEYQDGCLFHYLEWKTTNIGAYVNDNYKKGIVRLMDAIKKGEVNDDEAKYAKHLLAALACVYFEKRSSITQDKKGILYQLFSQDETFRDALKPYATFSEEALGELFYFAFTRLDKRIMALIYEEYISQYSKESDSYSYFTGAFSFKFTNCFCNLPLLSEETCEEYFSLCKYIDTILPELKFKTHQAYNFFEAATQSLNGLLALKPLVEEMNQGVFWINTEDLPLFIEFDYTYPNGKNGDIIKYIFEKYGETTINDGIIWHGRIEKKYVSYFGLFYSSLPLSISEDPRFHKIFRYHIPTIIDNRLSELALQKGSYFDSFREYRNIVVAHGKEQTQKRTEIYSQLILDGQASPKWKSEAQLFVLVSSVYPDAIYQYHTDWLRMQSLDIFIPSISVGIEYQGVQHYRAVDLFGGEDNFRHQQENDQKKRSLCKQNGVTLIEWPYNEVISKENLEKYLLDVLRK